MKYLKRFNESVSDFYEELSKLEFEDYQNIYKVDGYHYLEFTDLEVEKIQSEVMDLHIDRTKYYSLLLRDEMSEWKMLSTSQSVIGKNYLKFNIMKGSDEWFLVQQFGKSHRFYKCDQLDGLIKCLKDNYETS